MGLSEHEQGKMKGRTWSVRNGSVKWNAHNGDVVGLSWLVEALGVREVRKSVDASEGQVANLWITQRQPACPHKICEKG